MVWRLMKKKNRFDAISVSSCLSDSEIRVDEDPPANVKTQSLAETDSSSKSQRVSFSDVEIRNYSLILGDNPFVEVPLSLGWDYGETVHASVDDFEEHQLSGDYKNAQMMEPLDVTERQSRLRRVGYSKERIREEERRRRILLLLEWTYRHNREENAFYSCPHGPTSFKRYIM
jgi:hypothetical protein